MVDNRPAQGQQKPDPKPEPEPDEDKSPKLYPNPTKDYVTIIDDNIKKIKIYSISGTTLLEEDTKGNKVEIDMRKFARGIYLIHVVTETETKTYKLVRN